MTNSKQRVLALDPGKIIGWAIVENDARFSVIATGTLKRRNIRTDINTLVTRYLPDSIAYELSGKFLRFLYTIIIEEAVRTHHIPALGLKVSDVREYLFDDANMSKSDTGRILKHNILVLKPNISNHELDAISVGLAALNLAVPNA